MTDQTQHGHLEPSGGGHLEPSGGGHLEPSGGPDALTPAAASGWERVDARLAPLTDVWLRVQRSPRTRAAYRQDIRQWLVYCSNAAVDPLRAKASDVDGWIVAQRLSGSRGSRPAAESTIARRLAAVSAWYEYLLANTADDPVPLVARNPAARAARPRQSAHASPTIGLTAAETDRLLASADAAGTTAGALIRLVFTAGLRVGSALAARVEHLGHDQGHRTLDVTVKGRGRGVPERIPLPPVVATAIAAMLAERGDPAEGPLFVTPTGRPIYHMYVYRLVKRLARDADIPAAAQLTPHSLRHTAITLYLDATSGDVRGAQRFAGHARPETTMRYDRRRTSYSDHGAYVLAARFGEPPAPPGG